MFNDSFEEDNVKSTNTSVQRAWAPCLILGAIVQLQCGDTAKYNDQIQRRLLKPITLQTRKSACFEKAVQRIPRQEENGPSWNPDTAAKRRVYSPTEERDSCWKRKVAETGPGFCFPAALPIVLIMLHDCFSPVSLPPFPSLLSLSPT